MKNPSSDVAEAYTESLQAHLQAGGSFSRSKLSERLEECFSKSPPTFSQCIKIHEGAMLQKILPGLPAGKRTAVIARSSDFFSTALGYIRNPGKPRSPLTALERRIISLLNRHALELARSNSQLSEEILKRQSREKAFRVKERKYALLLKQSNLIRKRLRRLSRLILSTQEDERKKISRELHDVVAQALLGINIHLAAMKKEAFSNSRDLQKKIAATQRVVNRSADIVHRFARELRPPVLDDLGLIPALDTALEGFTKRSGVEAQLTAFAKVEAINVKCKTVLFRVAQEALSNVLRHAQAKNVRVDIQDLSTFARMDIHNDGKSFSVERVLLKRGSKRLGVVGMRERVEMVGGIFSITSSPGTGTIVRVDIPLQKGFRSLKND